MGMLGHAVEIMIVSQNAGPLTVDFWLDNEEYLKLSKKTDLFIGVSDTAELLERIPYGFRYPSGTNVDVRGVLEAFDFDEEYAEFEEDARSIPLKSIISVVLMSTINREYGEHSYEYTWVKYNLPTNKATTGTGFGESVFDADRYLKSLISVEGEELSTSVPGEAPVKKAVTTSSFDWEAYYEGLQKKGEQWLQTYGDIFEPNPVITFSSKTFVLSGTEVMDRQYKISVEKEIESRGGVVRKNVSGKTDYLVVDPRGAGEAKVKNALEQQKKGKTVKVVTGVDFLAAIQMPVEQEDAHEPTPVKPADGRQESTSCNKAEPKPEATKAAVRDFKISADGVLEKYTGQETYVAVPVGIRKIGTIAFWCKGLKTVIIPEGVEAIGERAFEYCDNLEEVVLPNSLRTIGKNAFGECKSIKHIIIPEGVVCIEKSAFNECSGLTSITLPNSLRSIKTNAFWGCTNLEKIRIPDLVTEIGESAFCMCSNLREIRLPNLVEEIGGCAFSGCSKLECVNIPEGVTVLAGGVFSECGSLERIDIPDSITSIAEDAFSQCTSLTSVTIPDNVKIIGARAFDGCVKLETVTLPNTLTSIGERVFHKCRKLSSITIPDSVESIGERAFHDCVSLGNVRIPSGVTQMGELCFFGCENLEYAIVTKGNCAEQYFAEEGIECRFEGEDAHTQPSRQRRAEVFLIDQNGVFSGYFGSSTSVVLPNSVKTLGPHCGFSDNVRGVIIPDSVTSIGDFAFWNCSALKEIIIPDSVTAIGKYAFSGCTGLEKVVISKGITSVEVCAFENCSALKEIIIPDSVTAIGCWAFIGCDNLTIIAPEGSYAQEFSESNWISFRIDDTEKKCKAAEEAERKRNVEEEAERKRQEELIAKRTRYDELSAAISLQLQIISQNKGWFGIQAKSRKTAQQQLAKLQEQLETEFPEGKP